MYQNITIMRHNRNDTSATEKPKSTDEEEQGMWIVSGGTSAIIFGAFRSKAGMVNTVFSVCLDTERKGACLIFQSENP